MTESRRALLLGTRGGGGEEVFLRDLAISPPPGWGYDMILDDHASVPGAQARRLQAAAFNRLVHPFLWPLPGLRSWRVDDRFDLVHVHNLPTLLRLPRGTPVVFTAGGGGYSHYLRRYLGWSDDAVRDRYARARRIHRSLGVRSEVGPPGLIDAFCVFSPLARDELTALGIDASRVHVVPPGFELPAPAPSTPPAFGASSDSGATLRLVLHGRDPHRKGADVAIDAVRRLRQDGIDVHLRLVGDPGYAEIAEDGVSGSAWMPREELLSEVVAGADVALVPSRSEGFGFAAVEALGYGVPVVVTRESALPWIVGEGGLVVPPSDSEALAAAIRRLASDPDLRRRLGAAGRARFEREFDRTVARGRLGEVYRQALAERPS